jgi:hypothetical protein
MRKFKIQVGKLGGMLSAGVLELDTETNCGVIEFVVTRKEDNKKTLLKHRPGVKAILWDKSAKHPLGSVGYYQNCYLDQTDEPHIDNMEFIIESEVVLTNEF